MAASARLPAAGAVAFLLLLLLLLEVVEVVSCDNTIVGTGSVSEILKNYGLPQGLLPATVTSYSLSENGKFDVQLKSTCTAKIGSEEVYYKKSITGELSYGKISNLAGIQAHEIFWVSVTGIEVDASNPNVIWFKVGLFSKSLSIDLFQVAPTCNSLDEDEDARSYSNWLPKDVGDALKVYVPNIFGPGARNMLQ